MRCKICTAVDPETPTGDYTNYPIVSEMGIFRQRREVTRGSALRWECFCIADDSDRNVISNSPVVTVKRARADEREIRLARVVSPGVSAPPPLYRRFCRLGRPASGASNIARSRQNISGRAPNIFRNPNWRSG